MLILSEEPWYDWFSLPEPGPWWDGLLRAVKEFYKIVLWPFVIGAAGWVVYGFPVGKPLWPGAVAWGTITLVAFIALLYTIDVCREGVNNWRLKRAKNEKLRIGPPF